MKHPLSSRLVILAAFTPILLTYCDQSDSGNPSPATGQPAPIAGSPGSFALIDPYLEHIQLLAQGIDPRVTYTVFSLSENSQPTPQLVASYLREGGFSATPGGSSREYTQFRQKPKHNQNAIIILNHQPGQYLIKIIHRGNIVEPFRTYEEATDPGIMPPDFSFDEEPAQDIPDESPLLPDKEDTPR